MASKRITLTEREIKYIVDGLLKLKGEAVIEYSVVKVGQQVYDDIIQKLSPKAGEEGFAESKKGK